MKYIVLFALIAKVLLINAQEKIEVSMSELAIDSLMQAAYIVEIPQASSKDAIKIWEDRLVPKNLLSTFKKLPKMEKENKNKWYINNIVIDEICADTLSVFTRITPLKDKILFAALFKTPQGFIGNTSEKDELHDRTSKFMRSHAIEVYKMAVQDEIDLLKRELKKMENDYSGYEKDNRKLERKSKDTESTLDAMHIFNETLPIEFNEEQMKEKHKEIKKEKKALKRYAKKIDNNIAKQKKLSKEIQKKEKEIELVEKKLKNIE